MRKDYLKTDELIRKAYMKLLFEKHTEKITVNAILEEADISRGTFYAHYKDISELAGYVIQEMNDSIVSQLEGKNIRDIIENPVEPVEHILGILIERKDLLKAVMTLTENPKIVGMIKEMFIKALQKNRIAEEKMEIADLVNACVAGAAFDACLMWLKDDRGISREKAVETISRFLSGGLSEIYLKK